MGVCSVLIKLLTYLLTYLLTFLLHQLTPEGRSIADFQLGVRCQYRWERSGKLLIDSEMVEVVHGSKRSSIMNMTLKVPLTI